MSNPTDRVAQRPNPIVQLVRAICKNDFSVARILDYFNAEPEVSFPTTPTARDVEEVQQKIHAHLDNENVAEALIFSIANLVATGQLRDFEKAKSVFDGINRCLTGGVPQNMMHALLCFVERSGQQLGFDSNQQSQLGQLTLVGNLCEQMPARAFTPEQQQWQLRALESFQKALRVTRRIDADRQEIASLHVVIGRVGLSLYNLGGGANVGHLEMAMRDLEKSHKAYAASDSPSMGEIEAQRLYSEGCRTAASTCEITLNEPALPEENRQELQSLVKSYLESALTHLVKALQIKPKWFPRRELVHATLHNELAMTELRLAGYDPVRYKKLLLESGVNTQQAINLWESDASPGLLLSARERLCTISELLWTECGEGSFDDVKILFEETLQSAQQLSRDLYAWRIAGTLLRFLIRHTPKDRQIDWEEAFRVSSCALDHLVKLASQESVIDDAFLRMIRRSTTWFWEYCFMAAGRSGHVEQLHSVFEARRVVSSKLSQEIRQTDYPLDRGRLVKLLPPDSAAVYMLLGDECLQAAIVHGGESGAEDYIYDPGTDWESVRMIVDPWIVANQRNRELNPTQAEFDWLREELQSMLPKLHGLLWRRIDERLAELGTEHVFLIRGRGLNALPLHAMCNRDGEALIDRYRVTYVSSGLLIDTPRIPVSNSAKILAVANPTSDLPGTELEVAFVTQCLPRRQQSVFEKSEATRGRIERRLPSADLFHYAGHAGFEVMLRGFVTVGQGELSLADEPLELDQLKPLELDRKPVIVLSACETSRTDWRDVESLSIADYFISCGARAVIATIWPVADISTALLMRELYTRARDTDLAQALREAQRWLRGLERSTVLDLLDELDFPAHLDLYVPHEPLPYANPYYWAPFILMSGTSRAPDGLYVIYDHPDDYPDHFVVRRFSIEGEGAKARTVPREIVAVVSSLKKARNHVPEGAINLGRFEQEDSKILESWLKQT